MKELIMQEVQQVNGGLMIADPSTCANGALAAGGFGAAIGGAVGALIGAAVGGPAAPVTAGLGAVLGASLLGAGSGAVALQGSACQPKE